jgi:branched-chain amino acid transport system ATP-binding protein
VEQNLAVCTDLADRHYIHERGRIVYHGNREEFMADNGILDKYLGVEVKP